MKRLIDHIIVKNEHITSFKNICFIDTPGFNPGSDTDTDKQTALEALANVNAFIWCVPCTAGTIRKDEFDILNEIFETKQDCKFYVILNKADQKPVDEAEDVLEDIYDNILSNGLDKYLEGMCLYSANKKFDSQDSDYSAHKGKTLLEFFKQYDIPNKKEKYEILEEISSVFEGYIDNDRELIEDYQSIIDSIAKSEYSFDMSINLYKSKLGKAEAIVIKNGGSPLDLEDFDDSSKSNLKNVRIQKNSKKKKSQKTEEQEFDKSDDTITYSNSYHEEMGKIERKFRNLIVKSNSNIEKAQDLKYKITSCFKEFWMSINKWDSYYDDSCEDLNFANNRDVLEVISSSDFNNAIEIVADELAQYLGSIGQNDYEKVKAKLSKYFKSVNSEEEVFEYLLSLIKDDDPDIMSMRARRVQDFCMRLNSVQDKLIVPDFLLDSISSKEEGIYDKKTLIDAVKRVLHIDLSKDEENKIQKGFDLVDYLENLTDKNR